MSAVKKKASPKKASPKKASPKKASPKKASPKKASPKKASPKKASPKKSPKKASPKKPSPKKASPKKASPKKASPKKASPKKASPKKASPKKASPGKAKSPVNYAKIKFFINKILKKKITDEDVMGYCGELFDYLFENNDSIPFKYIPKTKLLGKIWKVVKKIQDMNYTAVNTEPPMYTHKNRQDKELAELLKLLP